MSAVLPPRAERRAKRPLLALFQGLLTLALTLLGLLLVTFALSALSPVDRVLQIVGDHASQSTYAQVRHQLGLDQPLPLQFWRYLVNLAHGDLGIASSTGQPVLHDLSLDVPQGAFFGIVGHTGSGKSTLLSLLLRYYVADKGSIEIGGLPLAGIGNERFRNEVGLVPQDPFIL